MCFKKNMCFLSCFKSHKTLDFLKKYVGNSELSAILVKNVLLLGLIKPLSILLNLVTFPLCIYMVDKAQYGLFSTITAFTSWFSLFDLGIGNGLKNHLTLAIAQKDEEKAKKTGQYGVFLYWLHFWRSIAALFFGNTIC